MIIFRLTHNNFGDKILLAKFTSKPNEEKLKSVLSEVHHSITKIDFHCTNLVTHNSSSITVGEWLELTEE